MVPWKIDATESHLELRHIEDDDEDLNCQLDVYVDFGPLVDQGFPEYGARIRILFERACASKLTLKVGDEGTAELLGATHDDAVYTLLGGDRNKFWDKWRTEGYCPVPGACEMVPSEWAARLGWTRTTKPLKHFVFLGREAYAEVLAFSWSWQLLSPVKAPPIEEGTNSEQ
jgi:hypothetical protein